MKRLTLTIVAVALAGLVLAVPASAATAPPLLAKFCKGTSGEPLAGAAGHCVIPRGAAVNRSTGNLYVADQVNQRIDEFSAWGAFLRAWGWGVVASGPDDNPRNEIQELSVDATGGAFSLRYFNPGLEVSAPIPFNASAATVQSTLGAMAPNPIDAIVSGSDGGPWTIEYVGAQADTDVMHIGRDTESPKVVNSTLSGGAGTPTVKRVQQGADFEVCVPANDDVCRSGQEGTSSGQFANPSGLAVDAAGSVYVFDWVNNRVQKFDSEGNFLLTFGGEVDKTTNANVCTAASGDVCGAGVQGAAPGFFIRAPAIASYLAVGPGDQVYVGDKERVQVFDSSGNYLKSVALPGESVQSLAVDAGGNLYLAYWPQSENPEYFSEPDVHKLSPAGASLCTMEVSNPRAIAVDGSGTAYVVNRKGEAFPTSGILEFTPNCQKVDLGAPEPGFGSSELTGPTGIATTSACGVEGTDLFVPNSDHSESFIALYGSLPDPSICPPPAVPPSIDAQFATSADSSGATLKAQINPHFWPDTRYYLQYGKGKCSEGGCTSEKPLAPGSLLTKEPTDADFTTTDVFLEGLEANTTYHYRFVAKSGGGGPVSGVGGTEAEEGKEGTFHTLPLGSEPNTSCLNQIFRTGSSAKLPDCRAYELVSPLDKNNGDIALKTASFSQAAADGNAVTFDSFRAFGDPQAAPLNSQYLARRGNGGWTSQPISPPGNSISFYAGGATATAIQYKAFSENLCSGWLLQGTDVGLAPGATPGVPNLYRRDLCGEGGYGLLSSTPPPGFEFVTVGDSLYVPEIQGFSADGSRSVFRANAALAVQPGDPSPPFSCESKDKAETISYRWLRNGLPIPGAEAANYTPTTEDQGTVVQCQVTTSDGEGAGRSTGRAMAVAPAPVAAAPRPPKVKESLKTAPIAGTITGTPQPGQTLTCVPGEWRGAEALSYRWLRGGSPIAGAESPTYTLLGADRSTEMQCEITGSNASGAAVSDTEALLIGARTPLPSSAPTITGSAAVGQTLSCNPGTWQGAPSFSYQWLQNTANIASATASTYTLAPGDAGKAIQCRVRAANSDAVALALTAAAVVSPPPATTPPAQEKAAQLTGTAQVGKTLSCEAGSWSGSPTLAYKWLRNGATTGATGETYELTSADRAKAIQCQITASNAGGSVQAITPARYVDPVAPKAAAYSFSVYQVYEAHDGQLALVSVLPDGSAATAHSSVGTAQTALPGEFRQDSVHNGVSADGQRVFWSTSDKTDNGADDQPGHIYLRINATAEQSALAGEECLEATKACTLDVSGLVSSEPARFWDADREGKVAIFSVGKALYRYEAEPTPQATEIAAGVLGVMGASEDASRVYFASTEDLTPGEANGEGEEAVAGKPNLYLYEAGAGFAFVGTLSSTDVNGASANSNTVPSPIAPYVARRTSRVSPDGLHAAFLSTAQLTGYDNADVASGEADGEVFSYEADTGKLTCASCNPSGARPRGREIASGSNGTVRLRAAATLPGWVSQTHPGNPLSDNGNHLFFNSYDALVPGDTNGKEDVYEWEAPGEGDCTKQRSAFSEANEGCLYLITSGQSAEDAEFFDATPSGSDVFFATQSSLLVQDYGLTDVYDARVNGGFPAPAGQPAGCEGEACQGTPAAPNDPTPASSSFQGAGNVTEPTARKKHKHKKAKKQKHRHKATKHHGRANHNRRNGR
jgi:hypothetical protein